MIAGGLHERRTKAGPRGTSGCLVPNKDIGFVSEGQDVELKLEAFPLRATA
jgi:hypothetical protein